MVLLSEEKEKLSHVKKQLNYKTEKNPGLNYILYSMSGKTIIFRTQTIKWSMNHSSISV